MSNLHYENSAVLRLVSVTPVIAALFEPLALEGMPPEHGKCRVSVVIESERTDASWDRLRDGLQALSDARQIDLSQEHLDRLASTWELTIRTDPEPDVKTLLLALANDLDRVAWPGFLAFLDDMDQTEDASIKDRFFWLWCWTTATAWKVSLEALAGTPAKHLHFPAEALPRRLVLTSATCGIVTRRSTSRRRFQKTWPRIEGKRRLITYANM